MLINLSDVLFEQHKTIEQEVAVDFVSFQTTFGIFPVISKEPLELKIVYQGVKKLLITAKGKIILEGCCDRCLETAEIPFKISIHKEIDLNEDTASVYPEIKQEKGYYLDADQLVYDELLVGWPAKILCKEACRGLCNVCGQNLNTGACNCEDTSLNPQMAAIRDIFKNFKEV